MESKDQQQEEVDVGADADGMWEQVLLDLAAIRGALRGEPPAVLTGPRENKGAMPVAAWKRRYQGADPCA